MPNSPPLPSTRLTKWRQGKRLGVCRMHGARGGAPEGERNGNYRHGAGTFPGAASPSRYYRVHLRAQEVIEVTQDPLLRRRCNSVSGKRDRL